MLIPVPIVTNQPPTGTDGLPPPVGRRRVVPLSRALSISGLGADCGEGYFEEDGRCLVQTQQLANYVAGSGGVFGAPTQYYPGIYGPSVSPVGVPNLALQDLAADVRRAIEDAGHSIDCKRVTNCAGSVCVDEILCSVDGGDYDRSAYAINANPGVLLVELGQKLPLFPAAAPASAAAPAPAYEPKYEAPTGGQPGIITKEVPALPAGHSAPTAGTPFLIHTTPQRPGAGDAGVAESPGGFLSGSLIPRSLALTGCRPSLISLSSGFRSTS